MVIIGAKGFAKELLSAMIWSGYNTSDLFFFDNLSKDTSNVMFNKYPIIKSWEELALHFRINSSDFMLGVGSSQIRRDLATRAIDLGGTLRSFISNQALIGEYGNEISEGVCILPNVVMSCDISIGKGTLINKAVIIGHDSTIGKYCQISPGAKLLGKSTIESYSEIGAGAIILPGVTLGKNCIVGAGTVVDCDYPDNSIIVGMSGRLITHDILIK